MKYLNMREMNLNGSKCPIAIPEEWSGENPGLTIVQERQTIISIINESNEKVPPGDAKK
jgi:hypothetical protein